VCVPTHTQLNASDDHRTFRILIKYMRVCEYSRGRYILLLLLLLLYVSFFIHIYIFLHAHNIMVIRASTYYIGIVYIIYTAVSFVRAHTHIYIYVLCACTVCSYKYVWCVCVSVCACRGHKSIGPDVLPSRTTFIIYA
jgi:hypothetical protein